MSPKKLVLHDWNGCLLDDVPHRYENSVVPIFKHYGLPIPSLDDYSHNISSDFMRFYYDRGIPDSGDKAADGAALNAIMKSCMAKADMPPLFPETRTFLEALKTRCAFQLLVSSLVETEFNRQVDHHGVRPYFDETHGGIRKKAPLFTQLLAKYDVAPEDAVGFTDMMSDVHELAEAGVQAILIPRGYITPDFNAAPTMRIADDLLSALRLLDD